MPFAASTTTFSGPMRSGVHERDDLVDESVPDILRPHLAAAPDVPEALLGPAAHVVEPRVAADRQRAAPDDLHPRVLLRVVRGGDADAAVQPELADRVVDHLGPDEPEVEHVGAAVRGALDQRGGHRRRRDAHVAPDGDRARLELLDVGASDAVRALLVESRGMDAAHVVRLEDLRVEHGPDARDGRGDPHRRPVPRAAKTCGKPPGGRVAATLDFGCGAEARDRALRRPRRLDLARHVERPRGGSTAGDRVLRPREGAHRGVRRHRREVRRRRRAGGLRCPDRARGRRGARRASGDADRRDRRRRAAGADRDRGGRGGRRGRRLHVRDGRGAERRGAAPAVRRAGRDPDRPDRVRDDDRSDRRRAGDGTDAQGRPGGPRGSTRRVHGAADRPGRERDGAVRRARGGARPARQRVRARRPRPARAARDDLRRAGHREEPPRAGVLRGARADDRPHRPLAALRRGPHVPPAGRDGAGGGRDLARRLARRGVREAQGGVLVRRRRRPAGARVRGARQRLG